MDIEKILFVYRHINNNTIKVRSAVESYEYNDSDEWAHIATINAQAWIEHALNENVALAYWIER